MKLKNFLKYLNSLTSRIDDSHIKFYLRMDNVIIVKYVGFMDFVINSWSNKKDFLFGEHKKYHIKSFWEFCHTLCTIRSVGKLPDIIKVIQTDPFIKICSECSSIEELEIKLAMYGF